VLAAPAKNVSRNFGKEAPLLAGLDHVRFGPVLFMDGDGQHPPTLVETLVAHWLDDRYDVVFTAKAHRASDCSIVEALDPTHVGVASVSEPSPRDLASRFRVSKKTLVEKCWRGDISPMPMI
jgi:hypothetical protein